MSVPIFTSEEQAQGFNVSKIHACSWNLSPTRDLALPERAHSIHRQLKASWFPGHLHLCAFNQTGQTFTSSVFKYLCLGLLTRGYLPQDHNGWSVKGPVEACTSTPCPNRATQNRLPRTMCRCWRSPTEETQKFR